MSSHLALWKNVLTFTRFSNCAVINLVRYKLLVKNGIFQNTTTFSVFLMATKVKAKKPSLLYNVLESGTQDKLSLG